MASDTDSSDEPIYVFVDPSVEMNLGLWLLFAGATVFLALRLYFKTTRRHQLWWDDYILLVSWLLLLANDSLIVYEFRNGYVLPNSSYEWSNRMHILITISSCGTLIGQAWTKTAFGVTLIRMSNRWQCWILWFCIASMNIFMVIKVIFQWARVCGDEDYDVPWRLHVCLDDGPRDKLKEGGNVYNILMDFIFALFPWIITRGLNIKRAEKIGLCITMSLGMIVAIVSAIRVSWKDSGNDRNAYYIYHNGLSQVWYSSEITGTIIVQCIPILRPIVREIQTTRASSRRLDSTSNGQSPAFGSKMGSGKQMSTTVDSSAEPSLGFDKQQNTHIALQEISEEAVESRVSRSSRTPSGTGMEHRPGTAETWLQSDSEQSDVGDTSHSRHISGDGRTLSMATSVDIDIEAAPTRGYSLPLIVNDLSGDAKRDPDADGIESASSPLKLRDQTVLLRTSAVPSEGYSSVTDASMVLLSRQSETNA